MEETGVNRGRRRRGGEGPTVADVARAAGVSLMTVSRVVNGESRVSVETRSRVEQAIEQLNYVPNPAARSLAGGGQCRLALLYDNPSASFLSELLVGSLDQARRSDAQLLLEPYDPGEPTRALVSRLGKHRIDGVLLPAPLGDQADVVSALAAAGLPLARVAATVAMPHGHAVEIDDEAAAHAMARHLIDLGHRRIGFIAGSARYPVSALRLAGFERALREAGLSLEPGLVARGDYTYRAGLEAAEQLLSLSPRPTAIFASNDDMAAGAMAAAHRHGLDVPRDLSICGFDDTATARSIWPELTTIRQPAADMAARAVAILAEHVAVARRHQAMAQRVEPMSFELIRRASDGPPA
ncbi:MAG: LacI family DNA-binding transcriptional regulator [Sphingomonadales bacterium]|nr:LacI family DNA-binding transcriptional regulator [Sphingomonadales bacterium]